MSEKVKYYRVTQGNPDRFVDLVLKDDKLSLVADTLNITSNAIMAGSKGSFVLYETHPKVTRFILEVRDERDLGDKWSPSEYNLGGEGFATYAAAFEQLKVCIKQFPSLLYRISERGVEVSG